MSDDVTQNPPPTSPTGNRYPWRATLRTVVVSAIALLPLLPEIAKAAGVETVPVIASFLAVVAAVQRVLAVPGVEVWMQNTLGSFSAAPADDPQSQQLKSTQPGRHRKVK